MRYNANLRHFNIPDHQVDSAKINFSRNLGLLVFRSLRLLVSLILALPGIIMFSPVFIVAKVISTKKASQALAASTVKIKANDVIATWKILIGMGFAPLLYSLWSGLLTYYLRDSITRNKIVSFAAIYILCTIVTYSALIIGDNGMDVFKSLRPLYLSITTPGILKNLQKERSVLEEKITDVINTLGPELYPGFDGVSLSDKYRNGLEAFDEAEEDRKTSELRRRRQLRKQKESGKQPTRRGTETDAESDALSMINSDNSLSNIPIFSNADHRSGSVSSLTSLSSGFEIVEDMTKHDGLSAKIANAVRENRE